MSGRPALAKSRLSVRRTLRGSNGVPIDVVKTKSLSSQAALARNRRSSCTDRWARSASRQGSGRWMLRRLRSVFGSTSCSRPSNRLEAPSHCHDAFVQIDVVPLQAKRFAKTKSDRQRHGVQRPKRSPFRSREGGPAPGRRLTARFRCGSGRVVSPAVTHCDG